MDHISLPALLIGIKQVHTKKVCSKQGPLLAADPGPQLQNHAASVVGILGQKQQLQLLCEPILPLPGLQQLLPGQVPQLRVGKHPLRLPLHNPGRFQLPKGYRHRFKLLLLSCQIPQTGRVGIHLRLGQEQLHLLQAQGRPLQLFLHAHSPKAFLVSWMNLSRQNS